MFAYGPFGAQVGYGIRGASSEQTLVLVDGFPVTDPTTGAVQLGQFSTIGVSRIEVVESGSSTLYGTSAAGGVINIITSVPRGEYLEASTGSYGDSDFRAGYGTANVGLTLERHVATNDYPYPTFAYGPGATFPGGVRNYSYGDQSAGRLNFNVPLADGFVVRGRVDASASDIGVPGSLSFPSTTAIQNTSYDSGLFEIERDFANSRLTLSLTGSQTRLDYNDPIENGGESDTFTGRSQISLKDVITGKALDTTVGVDLSRSSGVFTFPGVPLDRAHRRFRRTGSARLKRRARPTFSSALHLLRAAVSLRDCAPKTIRRPARCSRPRSAASFTPATSASRVTSANRSSCRR